MDSEIDIMKRALMRERKARKAAEQTLELKSIELYEANKSLKELNALQDELLVERNEALRKSDARFEDLVESATDIIYRANGDGYFTYANPMAIKKMGYSIDELRTMHFTEVVSNRYRSKLKTFYAQQYADQTTHTYQEFQAISKNGNRLWIGQNVNFIFDREGRLDQVIAVARDITESKLSQTRLNKLIQNMQSAVLLEDEHRKIALVNQTFCDYFSIPMTPDDMIGLDCSQSAQETKGLFQNEAQFVERIEEVLAKREIVRADELILKDGRVFERDYIPVYIDNHYSGHLWNYRDITERRNYLNEVEQREEKYRGIIANMNLGLLEVDREERIVFANDSFCQMSGYPIDELMGRNASELFVRGESLDTMKAKNALREQGIGDAYEVASKNKRGEAKWWLISGAPRYNQAGEREGSIGIHLDITDQKELEKELLKARFQAEESSRAKESFLANMSHEIRTPMNGVLGMVRMLSKTDLTDQQRFYLNTIKSAADNLLVVINDILDLSKIEAGKLSIEEVNFDLKSTVEQALRVMSPKAEEKGLELRLTWDEQVSRTLKGDPYRLNQVLLNLIGNALKFTEKGSVLVQVKVENSSPLNQRINLKIIDTGVGMDADFLQNIFEKFSQEDRSTSRNFGGTGLGMSISKQLIELMHGTIALSSEKGSGTEVSITIPFRVSEAIEIDREEEQRQDWSQLRDKRILVAEDNELNRLVIEATLEPFGIEMTFASNGLEAVNLITKRTFDAVLMDIQMPQMNGVEATEYIRKELGLDLPIFALTANVLKGDSEHYTAAGMNDIVPKPFEEAEILGVFMKWLGNSKHEVRPSVDSPEAESVQLYSLKKIEKLSRGNPAFVQRLIHLFGEQATKAIHEVEKGVAESDWLTISKTAHRMKPSIDNLQIEMLKETVRTLETKAREGEEVEEITTLSSQFMAVLKQVVDQMNGLKNGSDQ